MVVSGELDLAAVADESELEGLRGHRLASLQAVAVFPKDHTLTRLEQVEFAQLADADVIALNAEDASRKRLDALLRQSGQALRISIETPYSSTVCQLALAGHGVGIANPATAVGMEAAGLAFRPLAAPVHFECHMILHGSRPLSEAGKFWATCLRAALAPCALRRLRLAMRPRPCEGVPSRIRVHAVTGTAGLSRAGRPTSGSARPTTRRPACPSVAAG